MVLALRICKGQAAEEAELRAGRGSAGTWGGDEGCPSTPGKMDPVRYLCRVTENIPDRDINNSSFAGVQIKH